MDQRHRILLYTLDGSMRVAEEFLAEHGLASQFELVSQAYEPFTFPSEDLLAGCEAVLGEMTPVRGPQVDALARAGVRLYCSMSIGLNHLDMPRMAELGVRVTNCPGYCADDVSVHAMALMLDLMRQVTLSNRDVRAGLWNPNLHYTMHRPQGQTMGLVFFGHIARKVVPLAQALGMHVLVWAPTKTAEEIAAAGAEKVPTLDDLLVRSDVVSLHCPLVPETQGLIGARELALMKPTAFLINTARGPVVDEEALADALEAGTIQGAGLDVLADESEGRRSQRLIQNPRCIVTPHSAFVTQESRDTLVRMSMESVVELLVEGREPERLCR